MMSMLCDQNAIVEAAATWYNGSLANQGTPALQTNTEESECRLTAARPCAAATVAAMCSMPRDRAIAKRLGVWER